MTPYAATVAMKSVTELGCFGPDGDGATVWAADAGATAIASSRTGGKKADPVDTGEIPTG
jgi:hypothetical protein